MVIFNILYYIKIIKNIEYAHYYGKPLLVYIHNKGKFEEESKKFLQNEEIVKFIVINLFYFIIYIINDKNESFYILGLLNTSSEMLEIEKFSENNNNFPSLLIFRINIFDKIEKLETIVDFIIFIIYIKKKLLFKKLFNDDDEILDNNSDYLNSLKSIFASYERIKEEEAKIEKNISSKIRYNSFINPELQQKIQEDRMFFLILLFII